MPDTLKLIITQPAYNDMLDIFEYIAQDNRTAASKLLNVFEDKFKCITAFPNMGYNPGYLPEGIQICIAAKHYQIVYTIKDEYLYILRVLTGYQDICSI